MLAAAYGVAQSVAREAAEMAERLGLPALVSRNLNTAGVCRVHAGDEGGLDDLQRAVEIARSMNDPLEETQASSNLTWMIAVRGDVRRAFERHLADCEVAERYAIEPYRRWMRGERLFYLYWRGEWDELEKRVAHFLEEVADGGHYLEAQAQSHRARVARARGGIDAIRHAETSLTRARGAGDPQIVDSSISLLARTYAEADDAAVATPLFDELIQRWETGPIEFVLASVDAAWAAVALGRERELLGVIQPAKHISPWIAAATAIASHDFTRAADIAAEIGLLPDEAFARLRAAEQFIRAGRRAEADEQLAQALAFWRSVNAAAYVREGEALLARAG